MILLILIPVLTALLVFLLKKDYVIKYSLLSIPIEVYIIYQLFLKVNAFGAQESIVGGWPKYFGISLYMDYLSFVFLAISIVAWVGSSLYSLMKRSDDYKFYFFLHFLRGTFYGLIFSNDLYNIFVFVEITSVISAMLFYLMGLIIIYMRLGTLNLSYISNLPLDTTTKVAFGMIVTALGVKSAFFPVYTWTWLPRAHMAAPSGMSALLSGVLVKAGFIVLVKLFRFIPEGLFFKYLLIMGILKAISGIMFALSQKDIKGVLAFHTISQSGIILMGIGGIGSLHIGGILHLVNHSLFKGLLFLTAGIVIKEYNARELKNIRGLLKNYPGLAFFMIVGILSITGFPYSNGYVSKHLIKYGLKGNIILEMSMHLISLGTVISFVKLSQVLFGEQKAKIDTTHKESKAPLFLVGGVTLFSGVGEMYVLRKYFDIVISVHFSDFITYGIYVSIGYLVYKFIITKDVKALKFLRHYQLGFEKANIVLVLFLILTMAFIY
jgi:multicomponent Na+:H+ antiporter subunit D